VTSLPSKRMAGLSGMLKAQSRSGSTRFTPHPP
jgi:hypothetical protein